MTEEYHQVSSNGNRENELPAVPGETCVTEMLSQVLSWVHAGTRFGEIHDTLPSYGLKSLPVCG
jgi:hypothetical protein